MTEKTLPTARLGYMAKIQIPLLNDDQTWWMPLDDDEAYALRMEMFEAQTDRGVQTSMGLRWRSRRIEGRTT